MASYDLSRLARNARLMLNLEHELDRLNLRLIVVAPPDGRGARITTAQRERLLAYA